MITNIKYFLPYKKDTNFATLKLKFSDIYEKNFPVFVLLFFYF
jgi:hypothetical protein